MKYTPSNMRMWSRLGPSGALGAAAIELGDTRKDVMFVSADMTFAAGLERFKQKYPDRHFETGIAEQNLVGFSAGLAIEGFTPCAVTYSTFLAARALDQIKMCLGYMRQNVKLIGLNAGFSAGILGPTHIASEDISIIRAIPNITLLSPADTTEIVKSIIAAAELEGPVFIRLTGAMNNPQVYESDYDYQIGKAIQLRDGGDVGIIATGSMVYYALQAAELLNREGIYCSVVNMHTIKPIDEEALSAFSEKKLIVTIEEHNILGGLGSAVAEILSKHSGPPVLLRLGINDYYPHASDYKSLLKECGLDSTGIVHSIRDVYMRRIK